MRSILLFSVLLFFGMSCSNRSEVKHPLPPGGKHTSPHPYQNTIFKNNLEFLKHEFPQDYEWGNRERKGLVELERDTNDGDFLEYTYTLNPLPAYGEIYKVNMMGNDLPEYISFVYFSPLLSWTNYAIVYNDELEAIDTLEVHSKEGLCHIDFKEFQQKGQYNLITEWEQSISVYQDAGVNIYELKEDGLKEILLLNTLFCNQKNYPIEELESGKEMATISTSSVKYLDDNKDGLKEILVRSTLIPDSLFSQNTDTLSDHLFLYSWDNQKNNFDKTVVISLEE